MPKLRALTFTISLIILSLSRIAEGSTDYNLVIPNTAGLEVLCNKEKFMDYVMQSSGHDASEMAQQLGVSEKDVKAMPAYKGIYKGFESTYLNNLSTALTMIINGYMGLGNFPACKIKILEPTNRKYQVSIDTVGDEAKLECSQDWIDAYFKIAMPHTVNLQYYTEEQKEQIKSSQELLVSGYASHALAGKPTGMECNVISSPKRGGTSRLASIIGAKTIKKELKVAKPKTKNELRLEDLKKNLFRVKNNSWREENGAFVKLSIQELWFAAKNGDQELKKLIVQYSKYSSSNVLKAELSMISQHFVPNFYIRYKDPKYVTEFEEPIFKYLNQNVKSGAIRDPEMFAGVFYRVWADIYESVAGYNQPPGPKKNPEWDKKVNEKSIFDSLDRYEKLDDHISLFSRSNKNEKVKNLERFNYEYPGLIDRYSFQKGE